MQGATSEQHQRWHNYPSTLKGVWMLYTMHGGEATVAEVASTENTQINVITMFTRRAPSYVTFRMQDVLSEMSVFIYLGRRSDYEWLEIGAYVRPRAGVVAYDRIRDIFDGHVFFTFAAPAPIQTVNQTWLRAPQADLSNAQIGFNLRSQRCAACQQPTITSVAVTRPAPLVPTTSRQIVDAIEPTNAWERLKED